MSRLASLRKTASAFPGSYEILEDGRIGKVSFIRYTNPNNITDAQYVAWKVRGGRDGSFTTRRSVDTFKALHYEGVL